jgi:soluble lytic murein transglycosylase-like protein
MRVAPLVALCVLGLCEPSRAEVKIELRADGTKIMVNEPGESRLRRLAGRLLPVPDGDVSRWIEEYALRSDLDPRLVQALIQVESGYNTRALSNKGAMGLMQLMPGTARELAVADPWDPEQNVRGGTTYLKRMIDRFGELELALAAYNAGPEAVVRHAGIPPYDETRAYVSRIFRLLTGEDGSGEIPVGRKVRIERDADNRIRLTTAGLGG